MWCVPCAQPLKSWFQAPPVPEVPEAPEKTRPCYFWGKPQTVTKTAKRETNLLRRISTHLEVYIRTHTPKKIPNQTKVNTVWWENHSDHLKSGGGPKQWCAYSPLSLSLFPLEQKVKRKRKKRKLREKYFVDHYVTTPNICSQIPCKDPGSCQWYNSLQKQKE